MPQSLPIATSHFLTGSVLTLVVPLGTLIAVALWYILLWRSGSVEGRSR